MNHYGFLLNNSAKDVVEKNHIVSRRVTKYPQWEEVRFYDFLLKDTLDLVAAIIRAKVDAEVYNRLK